MQLLKRAKPWHVWLHLKDFPGALGFIVLNKGKKPSSEDLGQAAEGLVKQTFKSKANQKNQEKFEVIFAECRHISPIKGDKLGRVTVKNEKSFIYKFNSDS